MLQFFTWYVWRSTFELVWDELLANSKFAVLEMLVV